MGTKSAETEKHFNKTKMCRFFAIGKCTKGAQCPFAHRQVELRKRPDLRGTKFCQTFLETGVCQNSTCTFAHSKQDFRSRGFLHKTKLCRNFQDGCCPLGRECNFAHSPTEVRGPKLSRATLQGLHAATMLEVRAAKLVEFGDEHENGEPLSDGGSNISTDCVGSSEELEKPQSRASSTYSTRLRKPMYVNLDLASNFPCENNFAHSSPGPRLSRATLQGLHAATMPELRAAKLVEFFDEHENGETWSDGMSNISTDYVDSSEDSEKPQSRASSTYSRNLKKPMYVNLDLASDFLCEKFAPSMLGDYKIGAGLVDPEYSARLLSDWDSCRQLM